MLYVTIFSVANHHVESWICRGQKTWLLIIQGNLTDQQYMDTDTVQPVVVTFACQQNSIFKILYTGKFLSKQCWDIILAPIQSRPDLSSNKEYVVHPTTYIQMWIFALFVSGTYGRRRRFPWFKLTLLKMVDFQQEHTNNCNCKF